MPAAILGQSFTSEEDLHRTVAVCRKMTTCIERDPALRAAADAEFDRIGLDQAVAQFRGGLEETKAIREASGCEAHYREAGGLFERAAALADQIRETKPTSLAGAIAMLEWENEDGCCDECLVNVVIAGLRDLRAQLSDDVVSLPT